MKNIFGKISGLVGSIFLATSAFAWTPTVEVVRDSNNVLLRVGGWTTAAEMNEMDWSTYNTKMMILNQAFDVTAAVVSLFTSGHPSVNFSLNGHFDLSIALNPYFQIDPMLYPVRLQVCKQAAYGGECADTAENLVKRDPADFTANATCYPDPTCATASGGFTTFPRVFSYYSQLLGYGFGGIEVTLDKATVISGLRMVVTNGALNGTPNSWGSNGVFLNIYSSLSGFVSSGAIGNVVNRATGQVVHSAFGIHPAGIPWTTDILTLTFATPITLPAGNYVFAPFSDGAAGGGGPMDILCTSTNLGTDYALDGNTTPPQVIPLSTGGGSFATRNTLAVDILGY